MGNKSLQLFLAVLTSGLLAGCGSAIDDQLPVVPVKGTVYLDEKPHTSGVLTLTPVRADDQKQDTRPVVSGEIKSDGTYVLTTYEQGDGAPTGEYTASLGAASTSDTDPAAMMSMMAGGPATADLSVTIPEGGSESLEIRFKAGKAKTTKADAPPTPGI